MIETPTAREFSVVLRTDEGAAASVDNPMDELIAPLDEDAADSIAAPWGGLYAHGDLVEVADVDEVEWLERESAVVTLRELHSFGHRVRLYFYPIELTFFAAVYMDDLLWRAMKSSEFDLAEKAFEEFVAQVNNRARAEVRRVQLEAKNAQLRRHIEESATRADRLLVNMQRHAAQKQRALDRDSALRNDIKQLEASRVQSQLHANRTLRQIGQLYSTCATQLPRPRSISSIYRKR
ncbi:hypothetical protein DyAD56_23275 [Dyella sp. AD56]|uniref:DUF2968 domain-containing protein n=1 Tax=Dyella sp. AD56 TaxID=1528744 RepID=UPI000CA7044C|nr:DUF2968 domain-containing protein [Dyella sp. AD56]PMQ02628.1 hypothetical protein DyAD56_23275 [Dyella sp. AD56]